MDLSLDVDRNRQSAIALASPSTDFTDRHEDLDDHTNRTYEKEKTVSQIVLPLSEMPKRTFDAGTGSGIVMALLLNALHNRFSHMPHLYTGREVDPANAAETLGRIPELLERHKQTVFALTNMTYAGGAPWLLPRKNPEQLVWKEIILKGETADDFRDQFRQLALFLTENWQMTNNHLPIKNTALVIYREDPHGALKEIIPQKGARLAGHDLVIASQPYRARAELEKIAKNTMAPLTRALAQGGRLVGIHAHDAGSAMDIVHEAWPGFDPLPYQGIDIFRAVQAQLTDDERAEITFKGQGNSQNDVLFGYDLKQLPERLLISAAWKAAVYAAQIDSAAVDAAVQSERLPEITRDILEKNGGNLSFCNGLYEFLRHGPPVV